MTKKSSSARMHLALDRMLDDAAAKARSAAAMDSRASSQPTTQQQQAAEFAAAHKPFFRKLLPGFISWEKQQRKQEEN